MAETRKVLTEDDLHYTMMNYSVHGTCLMDGRGGVGVLYKKDKEIQWRSDLSCRDIAVVELKFRKKKNIILCGVYLNPEGDIEVQIICLRSAWATA